MSEEANEDEAPAKGGGGKLGMIFGILNLGLTGYVIFSLMQVQAVQATQSKGPEKVIVKVPDNGPLVEMDSFVVNLNEPGTNRYLKSKVQVEVRDEDTVKEMETIKAKVRDDLLRYMSGLTIADTMGEQAKKEIRKQLLAKLQKRLGDEKVRDIYFSEFVVQ